MYSTHGRNFDTLLFQKVEPKWIEGKHEPYTICLWAACAGASESVIDCLRENGADKIRWDRTIDGKTFEEVVAQVPRFVHTRFCEM